MRLLLARHGQTESSKIGAFCGSSDPPLTTEGEEQAARLARRLARESIGAIYSSPLLRARRTAAILAGVLGAEVMVLPALREMDFGRWEGLQRGEIAARFPEALAAWEAEPDIHPPPDGEPAGRTWARGQEALSAIWRADGAVVVVAHRTFNRIVLAQLLGMPLRHFRRLGQDEACLNLLDLDAPWSATVVHTLNDTAHLLARFP